MIRFWLDKGVDGFRLDVINLISKDQRFLDDDGSDKRFVPDGRRFYTDGPRIHEYLKEMNKELLVEENCLLSEKCRQQVLIIVLDTPILMKKNFL